MGGILYVILGVRTGEIDLKGSSGPVVPVAQFDKEYPNALPFACAIRLAKDLDAEQSPGILQFNVVSRTGAAAETRILEQPILHWKAHV